LGRLNAKHLAPSLIFLAFPPIWASFSLHKMYPQMSPGIAIFIVAGHFPLVWLIALCFCLSNGMGMNMSISKNDKNSHLASIFYFFMSIFPQNCRNKVRKMSTTNFTCPWPMRHILGPSGKVHHKLEWNGLIQSILNHSEKGTAVSIPIAFTSFNHLSLLFSLSSVLFPLSNIVQNATAWHFGQQKGASCIQPTFLH